MSLVTYNFLEDMALVLCVPALATVICQLLRQPLLLGYLVAGMVVGPNAPRQRSWRRTPPARLAGTGSGRALRLSQSSNPNT